MTEAPPLSAVATTVDAARPVRRRFGLANRITVARGILTLALWVVLGLIGADHWAGEVPWLLAFVLFTSAAGSDGLDGYVARKRGEVSVFGRIADPLVDKLLVLGSLMFLLGASAVRGQVPAWAAAAILFRELFVTALRAAVEARGTSFSAVPLGKWKMVLQCIAVGAVLLHGAGFWLARASLFAPFDGPPTGSVPSVARALVLLAAAVTLVSCVGYARRGVALLRGGGRA